MNRGATTRPSADELKTQIRSWAPALQENSNEFEAALVMLAALHLGTGYGSGRKLAEFTGVEYQRILRFGRRLRRSGIWQGGGTVAEWDVERTGMLAFWCDVNVAIGHFELSERRWAVSGASP